MKIDLSSSHPSVVSLTQRFAVQIVIVITCGILGVLFAVISGQSANDIPNRTDTWALPQSTPFSLSSSIEDILINPIFGGTPVVIATEEEVEVVEKEVGSWTLIGIIAEGKTRTILYKDGESGRLIEARTGDQLPSGEQIVSIKENSIELVLENEQIRISLFQDLSNRED